MGDFRRLIVWQLANRLAVNLYRITGQFPRAEQFGLTAQCRRAAISIVSNIAEGSGRGTRPEFRRFVLIARGSLHELRAQVYLSQRLGFLGQPELDELEAQIDEVGRMLHALAFANGPSDD